jgi:hypothetical protein
MCYGLDPFVGFCGNNFRFNIRKYLNQMSDWLQKYLGISVFERKFVHLGTACFWNVIKYEDGYITVFVQHRSESVFIARVHLVIKVFTKVQSGERFRSLGPVFEQFKLLIRRSLLILFKWHTVIVAVCIHVMYFWYSLTPECHICKLPLWKLPQMYILYGLRLPSCHEAHKYWDSKALF